MKRFTAFAVLVFMVSAAAYGQTDRSEVRKGNREFKKGEYREADISYRRALVKDSTSVAANYNLGNTLYMNGDAAQALKYYGAIKDALAGSEHAADCHYNSGNAAVETKDWKAAVDYYHESLLLNPGDLDAKENYIYAKKKLEDQQNQDSDQNQDQNNQNQDQNKDQNQDQNKND
ncbi:MAG: tetratricopeptide repeat protein, partial [Candidatus Cryptobacteroides sp.]